VLVAGTSLLVASLIAGALFLVGRPVLGGVGPIFAHWRPHVGPGTVLAPLVAWLGVTHGPRLVQRLPWPVCLAALWAGGTAWAVSLALIDGWPTGIAGPFAGPREYLVEVPDAPATGELLATFADRIVAGQPDSWVTHVGGHPPGALLVYVGLDRIGLGGPMAAGVLSLLAFGGAAAAVAVAVQALADQRTGALAGLFVALSPLAMRATSADSVFMAVTSWGIACLALGATRHDLRGDAWALIGGVQLGAACYLSYGLVLMAPVAVAVGLAARRVRPLVVAALGALGVAALVTVAGFAWWEGLAQVRIRYFQGAGSLRPLWYWIWANLAAFALALGPAAVGGLGRLVATRGVGAPRGGGAPGGRRGRGRARRHAVGPEQG
jgi:hypothetical protein